ncbi:MAG TPA: amidase, partial [Dokdonella sp.]
MTDQPGDTELRGATAFQQLHWLASGRIDSARLVRASRDAIAQANPTLGAFLALDESAPGQAAASDSRRAGGRAIGRLDG